MSERDELRSRLQGGLDHLSHVAGNRAARGDYTDVRLVGDGLSIVILETEDTIQALKLAINSLSVAPKADGQTDSIWGKGAIYYDKT